MNLKKENRKMRETSINNFPIFFDGLVKKKNHYS